MILIHSKSHGQNNKQKIKTFTYTSDTIFLDSLMISPIDFNVNIGNVNISESDYKINYFKSTLLINKTIHDGEITVKYRTISSELSKTFRHKSTNFILDSVSEFNPRISDFSYHYDDNPYYFRDGGLNKSGTISRGISVGNNQDLSVNSSLNLQLSGKLSDEINVLASITDDNIPIQPDGNTQQLQDFDQVFIQLYNDNRKLTAGDFWIKSEKTHFLKYNKRGQGAAYEQRIKKDSNSFNTSSGSIAVSKGKYSRNIIQAIEGNQGPYRLTGAENERFIIVLAGTERVFIDGKELKRGQEYDYVIDYNLSEIVFTPKNLMTKDKRIVIEFQYSDKNYSRSLITFSHELERKKSNLRFNIYSEQDHKNQPLQFEPDDFDKIETLINAGDDVTRMFFTGADSIGYNNKAVFYKKIDSLGYSPVYVNSNDPEVAFYQVGFSDVGSGNGNYIEDAFSPLGRVYKWIKPDTLTNGLVIHKGQFEPVTLLNAPKKRQIISVGGDLKINKSTKLYSEVAFSNNDLNTFSNIDNQDNTGVSAKTGLDFEHYLNTEKSSKLFSNVEVEFVESKFTFIERFRSIEFERDWNIQNIPLLNNQILGKASLGYKTKNGLKLIGGSNLFYVDTTFRGLKHNLDAEIKKKTYRLNYSGSILNSEADVNSEFYRHIGLAEKTIGKLTFGYKDILEKNVFRGQENDSMLNTSYQFYDWQTYIETPDSSIHKVSLFYKQRLDNQPKNNGFKNASLAKGLGVDYIFSKTYKNTFKTRVEYRELDILDSTLINQKPENTIVGRVDYGANWGDGFFNANTYYEIGSGLEQKKEFVFIETNSGQGNFQWVDYNNDNVKDINEFESALFSDQANYIRIFTPSNTYVKAFNNQFSFSTYFNPSVKWSNKKKLLKAFSIISNQASITTNRKTTGNFTTEYYKPFLADIEDINLTSVNSSLRNILFINRTGSVIGGEYVFQESSSKILLTNGFDSRETVHHEIRTRLNIKKSFELVFTGLTENKLNTSDYTTTRSFNVNSNIASSSFSFQPSSKFRAEINGSFSEKQNTPLYGGEYASSIKTGSIIKINAQEKGVFQVEFNRIINSYNGEKNTPLEFEMLNGLKNGENFTWGAAIQRKISKSMQLTINYNGRKSEGNSVIHFGGVQVRAFF